MTAGNEERNVVRQQFARFASQCRPFAPLYRQVTLNGASRRDGRREAGVGSSAAVGNTTTCSRRGTTT